MYGQKRKNVFDSPLPNKKRFGNLGRSILRPCGSSSSSSRERDIPLNGNRKEMCLRSRQEDIVEEILLRLPLKPLHKCMSLSKNSRSLISSDFFAQKYRKYRMVDGHSKVLIGFFHQRVDAWFGHGEIGFIPVSTQGTRLMEQGFDGSLSYLEPANITDSVKPRFSLMASSNSFLLCKKEEFASDKSGTLIRRDYCICNPLTGQHKALPRPPDTILKFEFAMFNCSGDGYPCLDWMTYKVVLCSDIMESQHVHVEIFSSQTGEWVPMHLSSTIDYNLMPSGLVSPAMSKSGTVCLLSKFGDSTGMCCVMFNLKQKTNQLQMVTLPRPGFEVVSAMLCESQGRIYMTSRWSQVIELWELNEDKWMWDLKYKVKVVEFYSGVFENNPCFLGLDPSNPAVALIELDEITALVDLEKKTYVFTSPYPDMFELYFWHPYQWPLCAISDQRIDCL